MAHGRDAGSDDGSPCILYNRRTGTELLKFPVNGILTETGKAKCLEIVKEMEE